MNVVRIRVTGKIAGVGLVFPYDHKLDPDEKPLYRVPIYEVRLNERNIFKAVRFGYRGHFERPWDPHRKCDEGIVVQREVAAEWNGVYSPHSFGQGNGLPRGFRIRRDQVYIHEGPTKGDAAGTLSCVEIMSDHNADDWNRFLATVAREAGVQYVGAAVKARKVLVTVEAAAMPNGLLVGRLFRPPGKDFFLPKLIANWETTNVPWDGRS